MYYSEFLSTIVIASLAIEYVMTKAVFAHYLVVGPTYEAHVHQDIDDAMAMGLDGFVLNIGAPTQSFVSTTLGYLFGYATYKGFKLFVSIDASELCAIPYANGQSCNLLSTYKAIFQQYLGNPAYYKGPNGYPMISTYSAGGMNNTQWQAWKQSLNTTIYFIPDFDETQGYYQAATGWYSYWGSLVSGLFSWEASWPYRAGYGGAYPGDISPDLPVINGTQRHGLGYMIGWYIWRPLIIKSAEEDAGLSPLQYKDAYNTNLYRAGELNLPVRMQNILGMSPQPDFVEIITWNDGPESHYIGNIWPEQNNDTNGAVYASQAKAPHNAWQQVINPFIPAWKAGLDSSSMSPPPHVPAMGAMWYKTILQNSSCPNNEAGFYGEEPDGSNTGQDALSYALTVPARSTGLKISAFSNGVCLHTTALSPGFNYGSINGVRAGQQMLNLLDATGTVIMSATNGLAVSSGCPDGIYNFNYQVIALKQVTTNPGYNCCMFGGRRK